MTATPCLGSAVTLPSVADPQLYDRCGLSQLRAVNRPGGSRVDGNAQPHGGHDPAGIPAEAQHPVAGERSDHRPNRNAPVLPNRDLPEGEPEAHQHRGERQGQWCSGQDHHESDGRTGDPRSELACGTADQFIPLGQDTEVVEHFGFSHERHPLPHLAPRISRPLRPVPLGRATPVVPKLRLVLAAGR